MATGPLSVATGGATPKPDGSPLERRAFTEELLPAEPASDRKIVFEDGAAFRERLIEIDVNAEGVLTSAENPSPVRLAYAITNALLDADGSVAKDADGNLMLSSRHELVFTAEALGRLGTEEAVQAAILAARERAAAQAGMEFRGMRLREAMLSPRAKPVSEEANDAEL